MQVNDSEKRRRQLLEETRERYSDSYYLPAVHPRYRSVYRHLYRSEEEDEQSTFGVRFLICLLLFAAFVTMDAKDEEVFHIDSQRIVHEVQRQIDVLEVWKNL